MDSTISIKGIREGLLITVPDGPWAGVLPDLLTRIDGGADFFRGAKVALQLGSRSLSAAELGRLRDQLSEREVQLWVALAESPSTLKSAEALGLLTEIPGPPPRPDPDDEPLDSRVSGDEAVLARRTLRSGNSIRHSGNVVVIGDVNPGAEIIAGGNVVVWGRLRGVVHAGATGDENSVVCALDLSPTQLRIAGHIAISPDRKGRSKPEMAHIKDGQLVAESWNPKD